MTSNQEIRQSLAQAGFSLLEVVITMAILAVGLLGMAGLQARAHNAEVEAYDRGQALLLATMMADRIAANRADADESKTGATSQYNTPAQTYGVGHAAMTCGGLGAALIACTDVKEWDEALKGSGVSGARGCVKREAPGGFQQYVVEVAWAGRGRLGASPTDRLCGNGAIAIDRRVVSVVVPIPNLSGV